MGATSAMGNESCSLCLGQRAQSVSRAREAVGQRFSIASDRKSDEALDNESDEDEDYFPSAAINLKERKEGLNTPKFYDLAVNDSDCDTLLFEGADDVNYSESDSSER